MKEILKTLTEAMMLPEDSYSQQDDEFLEIFVEEIEEIFVELQSFRFTNGCNLKMLLRLLKSAVIFIH